MSTLRESWSNAPRSRRLLLIVAMLIIPCLCILALVRIVQPLLPGDGGETPIPPTATPVAGLPTDTPAPLPATDTATPVVPTSEATDAPVAGATDTPTPDLSTHTPTPTATPRSDLPDTGGVLSPEARPILTWVGIGVLLLLIIGAIRRLRRPVVD